jgi:hypothetical protein
LIKNLLVKTTDDIRRQSDLILTFKESINENVNGIKKISTHIETEEDVSLHKTNIEFNSNTLHTDDKSHASSNHKLNKLGIDSINYMDSNIFDTNITKINNNFRTTHSPKSAQNKKSNVIVENMKIILNNIVPMKKYNLLLNENKFLRKLIEGSVYDKSLRKQM